MAGIAVHYRKLEKAADHHSRASEALDASAGLSKNLLLFYAAECKLKFAVLKTKLETERIDGTTDDLKLSFGSSGHNLIEGMKNFKKISKADLFETDEPIREWRERKPPQGTKHSFEKLHQAWRYGVPIVEDDERKCVAWLVNLMGILVREI